MSKKLLFKAMAYDSTLIHAQNKKKLFIDTDNINEESMVNQTEIQMIKWITGSILNLSHI